jgi:hypothetical protein
VVLKRVALVIVIVGSLLATGNAVTRQRSTRHVAAGSRRRIHRAVHRLSPRRASARLRRIAWHPMFPGSHEMLVRQNVQLDKLALPRIADEQELIAREQAQELVPVQDSQSLVVASNLPDNRRYCKPWTRDFLQDLSEDYYEQFHKQLVATSLVRTAEQQKKLRRHNGNAAPQEGDTASTHLTGVTVDVLKRGMTRKEHQWMEQYFLPLREAGLIEPIEERRQPVFHIVVFDSYSPAREPAVDTPKIEAGPQVTPIPVAIPDFQTAAGSGASN